MKRYTSKTQTASKEYYNPERQINAIIRELESALHRELRGLDGSYNIRQAWMHVADLEKSYEVQVKLAVQTVRESARLSVGRPDDELFAELGM